MIALIFTLYAMIGLIIQIILGEIFELEGRLYSTELYFIALIVAFILIASLIPAIKRMSRWIARSYWIPEIAQKAKTNFLLAKYVIERNGRTENNPNPSQKEKEDNFSQATRITDWLEELFEMKSDRQDSASRLQFFEKIFK
jgi:hypothetical protein